MNEKISTERRYDLDWLRVLAMFTIFFYHSLRFFNLEDWIIKNSITYQMLENLGNYLEGWMMPLIFVVSGASIFFELRNGKPAGKFIQGKILRLLVPLVAGIFTYSILQVYLERLSHGEFSGSFWAFLPHYFVGLYRLGGNFAWMGLHLWYLEVLFAFCIVTLPVVLWLRGEKGKQLLARFGDHLARPGAVYLLALAFLLSWKLLDPESLLGKNIFGWPLGIHLTFFVSGYLFVSSERLGESIQRQRWFSYAGALAASIFFYVTQEHGDLLVWFMLLALLGFARQRLSFSSPALRYANQAVLPFYILHQPVLVCVGFFVVGWQIPDLLKYLFITFPSFILTLGMYEFLARRFNALRFLFGMKHAPRTPRPVEAAPLGNRSLF